MRPDTAQKVGRQSSAHRLETCAGRTAVRALPPDLQSQNPRPESTAEYSVTKAVICG